MEMVLETFFNCFLPGEYVFSLLTLLSIRFKEQVCSSVFLLRGKEIESLKIDILKKWKGRHSEQEDEMPEEGISISP